MKVSHLTGRDFRPQPWKNGAGMATELAAHREGPGLVWRLSLADVARSGPFSDYGGYERTIMLIDGRGMELAFAGGSRFMLSEPYRPFVFDGAAGTTCRLLDGPVKDINLIVDRARCRATCKILDGTESSAIGIEAPWVLVYALGGAVRIKGPGIDCTLCGGELLRIDDADRCLLAIDGPGATPIAAVMQIHRKSADA
jgi:environmental stress-induced protein Ves